MKTIRSVISILLSGVLLLLLLGGCIQRDPEPSGTAARPSGGGGGAGGVVSGQSLSNAAQQEPAPEPNRVRILLSWNTANGANT